MGHPRCALLLRRSLTWYKHNFAILNTLSLLTFGTGFLVWAFLFLILCLTFDVDGSKLGDPNHPMYLQEHMGAFWCLVSIKSLVMIVVGTVGTPAMIRAVADTYVDRKSSARHYVTVGVDYFWPNVLASFLAGLGVLLGLVFFIAPGIYVGIMWVTVHAAIVIGEDDMAFLLKELFVWIFPFLLSLTTVVVSCLFSEKRDWRQWLVSRSHGAWCLAGGAMFLVPNSLSYLVCMPLLIFGLPCWPHLCSHFGGPSSLPFPRPLQRLSLPPSSRSFT